MRNQTPMVYGTRFFPYKNCGAAIGLDIDLYLKSFLWFSQFQLRLRHSEQWQAKLSIIGQASYIFLKDERLLNHFSEIFRADCKKDLINKFPTKKRVPSERKVSSRVQAHNHRQRCYQQKWKMNEPIANLTVTVNFEYNSTGIMFGSPSYLKTCATDVISCRAFLTEVPPNNW